jgi:hypothetical protein
LTASETPWSWLEKKLGLLGLEVKNAGKRTVGFSRTQATGIPGFKNFLQMFQSVEDLMTFMKCNGLGESIAREW